MRNVICYDDTLRDGEQQVGVFFDNTQKKELVRDIVDAGIDYVILMPLHRSEAKLVKELIDEGYKDQICVTTMMRRGQIEQAKDLGARRVIPFALTSDMLIRFLGLSKEQNLQDIIEKLKYADSLGLEVDFAAVDAARADKEYLFNLLREIRPYVKGGVIFFCDTIGGSTPENYGKDIRELIENAPDGFKIGVHNHNDRGYANQNAIEGIKAGAEALDSTIGGIGDRAGNANTEAVLFELKNLGIFNSPKIKYEKLPVIRDKVYLYGGSKPAEPQSPEAFWHEAGIHVDWLNKSRAKKEFYGPFLTEYFGCKDEVFLGKQMGVANLIYHEQTLISHFGNKFTLDQYKEMRDQIKELSIAKKTSFTIEQIVEFIKKEVINPFYSHEKSKPTDDSREAERSLYEM